MSNDYSSDPPVATAGHSNTDPGAVNGKIKEADLVVNFRNAVTHYLREAGLQGYIAEAWCLINTTSEKMSILSTRSSQIYSDV